MSHTFYKQPPDNPDEPIMFSRLFIISTLTMIAGPAIATTADHFLCHYSFEDESGKLYDGHSYFEVIRRSSERRGNFEFLYGEIGGPFGFGGGAERSAGGYVSSHYHYAYYLAYEYGSDGNIVKAWQSSRCADSEIQWGNRAISADCPPMPNFPDTNKWTEIQVSENPPALNKDLFEPDELSIADAGGTFKLACNYEGVEQLSSLVGTKH